MYGATELSKMFNTTRQTVYAKWKDDRLKEYLIENDGKRKLKTEGLHLFTFIMSESKIVENLNVTNTQNIDDTVTVENDTKSTDFTKEYIESLKAQIEDLKKDKSILQEQLSQVMNTLLDRQKQLEAPKERKSIWRIFDR